MPSKTDDGPVAAADVAPGLATRLPAAEVERIERAALALAEAILYGGGLTA